VDLHETGLGTLVVVATLAGRCLSMTRARIVLVVVHRGAYDLRARPRRARGDRSDVTRDDAPLANHLVERDARRHRHVQRGDVAEEGEGDEVVAVLADQAPKALALSAEHQGDGTSTVDLVPPLRARRVEPDDPDAARLHGFERLDEVAPAGHSHVLEGAGRSAGHGLGESGRVPLRQHDTVGSRGLGRPQDGPEVPGILDAVEHHDEGGLPRRVEELLEDDEGLLRHHGDEALVGNAARHAVQRFPGLEAKGNPELARAADGVGDPPVAQALDHEQSVEMTGARGQRLEHGVDAANEVHGVFVK
jgi:hypothetical protein